MSFETGTLSFETGRGGRGGWMGDRLSSRFKKNREGMGLVDGCEVVSWRA